jgi:pimeloyl-ACP methyl ester carboxylesterase
MLLVHQLELLLKLVLCALSLALIALAFFAELLVKNQCKLLLKPTFCQAYDDATDAIPLAYNFGTLIKYPGEAAESVCLLVHGGFGNLNTWKPFIDLARTTSHTVYALEPRGFGQDRSKTSIATFILSVKFAMAKLRSILPEGTEPNILGIGLGGQLARFANHAFHLRAPQCIFLNAPVWPEWEAKFPWLKQCRTLALKDVPVDTSKYFICRHSTAAGSSLAR